jgi:hypothetical protein
MKSDKQENITKTSGGLGSKLLQEPVKEAKL